MSGKDDFSNSDDGQTQILGKTQETLSRELADAKKLPACFIIIRGSPQGHRLSIDKNEVFIGRDPTADLSVNDPSVSRKHARVKQVAGKVIIEDLGSSNGSKVNGNPLKAGEMVVLSKEDMIQLGNLLLKYLPAGEVETMYLAQLSDAKNIDALTKIFNKGYFSEVLDSEYKRARSLNVPLSLIFFDLDHFKNVNDTYGHDAGDQILREFSKVVKSFVPQKSIFARYGGEEFCMLLPGMNGRQAAELGDKVRATVQEHSFLYDGKRIPVTSSVGVAELKTEFDSSQAFLKTADKALYHSKQTGRNRVTLAV